MKAVLFLGALSLGLADSSSAQTSQGTWRDITPETGGSFYSQSFDSLSDGRLVLWREVPWISDDGASWQRLLDEPVHASARLVAAATDDLWVLDSEGGRVFRIEGGRLALKRETPADASLSLASTSAGGLWLSAAGERAGGALSRTSSVSQSFDGGETWELRSNQRLLELISPFGDHPLVALRDNLQSDVPELSTSDDGGRSWTTRLPEASELYTDPRSPEVLWAIYERPSEGPAYPFRTLFRSEDRGLNWLRIELPLWVPFAVSKSGLLALTWEGVRGDFDGRLVRSDGSAPWQFVRSAEVASGLHASRDGQNVALFDFEGTASYQLSTDGGLSFSRAQLPRRNTPSALSTPRDKGTLVTSTGVSFDRGATWQTTEAGAFDQILAITPTVVLASRSDAFGLVELGLSTDGGLTFADVLPTGLGNSLILSTDLTSNGTPVLFLLERTTCEIFESTDLGVSWRSTDLICPSSSTGYLQSFDARVVGSQRQAVLLTYNFAPANSEGIWRLTTGQEPKSLGGRGGVFRETIDFDGNEVVLLGRPAERTVDAGETWQAFPLQPDESLLAWKSSPTNPALHYAASQRAAYRSTDSGNTWQLISGSDNAEIVDLQVEDDSSILVLTENGLYRWTSSDCVPGPASLCLGGRFQVTASFSAGGPLRTARSFRLTEDTGTFWFFEPDNLEILVKVLDGCDVNGHYWVFTAGLTDVEVEIEITELPTGNHWTTEHPGSSAFPPGSDVQAFACAKSKGAASSGRE